MASLEHQWLSTTLEHGFLDISTDAQRTVFALSQLCADHVSSTSYITEVRIASLS